ncbi:MAG: DUF2167 domain-containing protein [Dokdonella sp.]
MRGIHSVLFACALGVTTVAVAQSDAGSTDESSKVKQFLSQLHYQAGTIQVPEAGATLKLVPEYRYLGAQDAQKVLEKLWGNPPDSDVLGMILPQGEATLSKEGSWAVVVTYSSDGFVSDEEAAKTDCEKMLKEMQDDTRDANAERKKQGYDEVELVGWATKPHYDHADNKLYWAKELAFGGRADHTLNYDIRALGRKGYLSLNAIADMSQLPRVEEGMQRVLGMTEFDPGSRYADFDKSTDKIAAYGIAALVAGGIAAKAGLFAKLFALLLAAKKVIFLGLAAAGGVIGKLFKRKAR